MFAKKPLIAALTATTFLTAGVAFAAEQAAQPSGQQAAAQDANKLSADGAHAFNDLALTRLAIYDGRVADAKKLIDDADTALGKAKTDDSVFLKAEADLRSPDGNAGAQKTEADKDASVADPNAAKQAASAKAAAGATPIRWLPIDADMSVDEDFAANPAKAAAVADANKSLAKGDKAGAEAKLKLADVAVTYVMAVVPLDQTLADVHQAAQLIDDGKYYEGSQMLRQVQDSTRYDVIEATGVPGKAASAKAAESATH